MQTMLHCKLLDRRLVELMAASGWFVGHRDHTDHIVASVDNAAQTLDGKIRSAEEYDF